MEANRGAGKGWFLAAALTAVCTGAPGCGAAQKIELASSKDRPLVAMTDRKTFEPSFLDVRRGATVVWRNTSALTHTVTADPSLAADPAHVEFPSAAIPFDSGEVQPGGQFAHRFDEPGIYRYVCLPWETAGMAGSVRVSR
ncbi:MAG: hypothetical protein HYY06_31580 [Deltaproteobacteria bacterium]|nr:hypothetical protein [Deltaproteobacteria bacterium]